MNRSFFEELQFNAFPSLSAVLYDGWAVRFGGGFTYRVNCAWQVAAGAESAPSAAEYIEGLYASRAMPAILRLYDGMPGGPPIDAALDARRYLTERRGNVFICALDGSGTDSVPGVLIESQPSDAWISGFLDMNGTFDPPMRGAAAKMIKSISYPTIAAWIKDGDKPIACGLGVYERGFVGLYDIFVNADYRRRGLGNQICAAIMAEGKKLGAHHAYLQVLSDNEGARAMYRRLGYEQDYEYWFRVKK